MEALPRVPTVVMATNYKKAAMYAVAGNGFEIDILNDIHALNFKPMPFSKGEVCNYRR